MHKVTARTLLFLMLITVFGQVMALPCAEMHRASVDGAAADSVSTPQHHSGHAGAARAMHGNQCSDTPASDAPHCAERTSMSDDCGQGCTCCPGHCASALPATEGRTNLPFRGRPITSYSDIASSPEPETAIRPPIYG